MDKWADYLISKVQYNNQHTRIIKVIQHIDTGDQVGTGKEVSRLDVVTRLKSGNKYCTIFWNNGKWKKSDNVIPYESRGEYFIRPDEMIREFTFKQNSKIWVSNNAVSFSQKDVIDENSVDQDSRDGKRGNAKVVKPTED